METTNFYTILPKDMANRGAPCKNSSAINILYFHKLRLKNFFREWWFDLRIALQGCLKTFESGNLEQNGFAEYTEGPLVCLI